MSADLITRLESADGPDMRGYVSDRVFEGHRLLDPTAAEAHRKRLIRALDPAKIVGEG